MSNANQGDEKLPEEEAKRVFDWVLQRLLDGENISSELKSELSINFMNYIILPKSSLREYKK